jgi:hypothetical protein
MLDTARAQDRIISGMQNSSLDSDQADAPSGEQIKITTNEPGYLIEVNDNIVGVSPCSIPKPRKQYYRSGVEKYQGMTIKAIPSSEVKAYASKIGGIAMGESKRVSDPAEVSHVHLDTWFADPEKLRERNRNTINVYGY